MISFWERESLLEYDIIIIGAGLVGLQTSIQIKNKYPNYRVLILERGLLPSGASTRNAGFAATGSLSELVSDARTMSDDAIFNLFAKRKRGLDFLRKQLGDDAIGYRNDGSYELLTSKESNILEHLDHFNYLLKELHSDPIFEVQNKMIGSFGFNHSYFKYCLTNSTEASLHSGKLIKSLHTLAIQKGVEVKTGAQVNALHTENNHVRVDANNSSQEISLKANQVVVCTNAFSKLFFPDVELQPGRGQVMITKPIKDLHLKGIFHFDEGYYYFRNVENRLLFGGGRNLDFDRERTTEIQLNEAIQQHLIELTSAHILPHQAFEVDMQWAGIMAFGKEKSPVISSINSRIHGGFRLGGMGVALSSMIALELSEKITRL